MTVYLAGPNTQQQAQAVAGMPVLLSFAYYAKWTDRYQHTFSRILIDSGAYSELSSGRKVDVGEYAGWAERWVGHADAIAGLDDIRGDWRRSMANYSAFPAGFPTFHDTDPPELLPELIAMAQGRGNWLGIGLLPPREGKGSWLRDTLSRIPPALHVHGWALRRYAHIRRLDSMDSTNWWRDGFKLRTLPDLSHLTYGECLEIVVKRYAREGRQFIEEEPGLFNTEDVKP